MNGNVIKILYKITINLMKCKCKGMSERMYMLLKN